MCTVLLFVRGEADLRLNASHSRFSQAAPGAHYEMAATSLRDLLATTDLLFNKSETLNAELTRLVRAIQSRRAPAEVAEIVRIAAAGIDASSLQHLAAASGSASGSTAPAPTPLEQALADCRAASAAMCVGHAAMGVARPARA